MLIDNMLSLSGNHNGGDLQFGKDGYLYIAVGDGGCDYIPNGSCSDGNRAARNPRMLLGKILRIIPDPTIPASARIPADNPFRSNGSICADQGRGPEGPPCQETFAMGLRNPFRMAFAPDTMKSG
jgi:glucose/arabinose dehydrogenase